MGKDLRYCFRALLKSPGLFAVAIVSLALGIGLNLTVFGLFESMFFRGVTAADPDHTFHVWIGGSNRASYPNLHDLRDARAVAQLAGYEITEFSLDEGGQRQKISGQAVTGDYFEMLGVTPFLGRRFSAEEKAPERELPVAILSYPFWQQRFHSDREVLGRALRLNGRPFTVIGVLPDGYRSIHGFAMEPPFYVPYSSAMDAGYRQRGAHPLDLIMRTGPAQTRAGAEAAMTAAVRELGRLYPTDNPAFDHVKVYGISVFDAMEDQEGPRIALVFFIILSVVTTLILTIACANVAGLLVARAVYRRREVSIRLALGASRGRLVRLFLAEGIVLATCGLAAAGLLFSWAANGIRYLSLPIEIPFYVRPELNWRMALYALSIAVFTAIFCSVAPALEAARANLSSGLKNEIAATSRGRLFSMRNGLVTGQVAVSMLLLVVSLLFVRSLRDVQKADPGFNVANQVVASARLDRPGAGSGQNLALTDAIMERLAKAPGVVSVSAAMIVPLSRDSWVTGVRLHDDPNQQPAVQANAVGPQYFRTMGIRVLAGREFTAADTNAAPDVALVNHSFAAQYFRGQNPVGQTVSIPGEKPATWHPWLIVGVVADSKHASLGEGPTPVLYRPYKQEGLLMLPHIHVRTAGSAAAAVSTVRSAMRAVAPEALVEVSTMQQNIASAIYPNQIGAALLGFMGGLGLLLASIGLYGVLTYAVSRRVREIGVRMALGATRGNVLRVVLEDAAMLVCSGMAIGMLLAIACTKPLSSFLSANISATDPVTLGTVAAVFVATGMAAALVPARRAMRVDPLTALRCD
ncbi:MAG TPA: ABC transporter permease [Bryobacteraceae bacterium]|nr:ABC transporter permease [Bryobacteraceae bacterium]